MKEVQPIIKHSNPQDYGLTQDWAYRRRLLFLRNSLAPIKESLSIINKQLLTCSRSEQWFPLMYWKDFDAKHQKIENNIRYVRALLSGAKEKYSYDLVALKQIPIDTIVEVNSAGFFKLRDEKTPSCKWYKEKNTWHDFGSGEHGDVIDLIMKLNNCTFQEACRLLTFKS